MAARSAYRSALRLPGCLAPDARSGAAKALGDLELQVGDAAAAAEAYAGSHDPGALANLGFSLISLGRAAEAETVLEAALASDSAQPEARLALAFAFEALGRKADALDSFRAFLALAPHHAAASRARAEISVSINERSIPKHCGMRDNGRWS